MSEQTIRPAAGQRWRHPEVGYRFQAGIAHLLRRAASGSVVEVRVLGWDYQAGDGAVGFIPEDDLLARGELLGLGAFSFGERLDEHPIGDADCEVCWSGYPMPCDADECTGLVHADFGDENADCDYWLFTACDVCGESE